MDDDSYSLSPEGARMMATIIFEAIEMGLFQKELLSEQTIAGYINLLAKEDSLWEGFDLEEIEERKAILAMALMSMLESNKNLN